MTIITYIFGYNFFFGNSRQMKYAPDLLQKLVAILKIQIYFKIRNSTYQFEEFKSAKNNIWCRILSCKSKKMR